MLATTWFSLLKRFTKQQHEAEVKGDLLKREGLFCRSTALSGINKENKGGMEVENEQEENRKQEEVEAPGRFWMFLMMFLFFPVGLVMMWTNKQFTKMERVGITIAFGSYTSFVILVGMFLGATAMDTVHEWKEKDLPGQMEKLNKALNGNGKDEYPSQVKEGASEHVKQDLLHYLNESTPPLVERETEIMNRYQGVTGSNYVDDQTTHRTLVEEVIPQYKAFLKDVKEVSPSTMELRNAHQKYVNAAQLQYSAYHDFATALEEKDEAKMDDVNRKFRESEEFLQAYTTEVFALAKENNLEIGKN